MKKIKKIGIVYDPLNITISLKITGGALTQRHNANTLEYMPDRSITPLVIEPVFYVNDPNGSRGGEVRSLVNPRWYAVPQDVAAALPGNAYLENELSSYIIGGGTADYTLGQNGSLTVSKNVPFLEPQVLIFVADYYDERTGITIKVMASDTMVTTSTVLSPTLEIDKPSGWTFDPVHDSGLRQIRATLKLSGNSLEQNTRYAPRYWWYVVENNSETLISDDHLFYEGGQNTATLTIDPRYVNGNVRIRCKAEMYLRSGNAPSTPSSDALAINTYVTRRYPEYDWEDYAHGSVDVSPGAERQKHECIVRVGQSVVDNPEAFFTIRWYVKTSTYGSDWREVGSGGTFFLEKNYISQGCYVAVDIEEHQPMGALCSGNRALSFNDKPLTI